MDLRLKNAKWLSVHLGGKGLALSLILWLSCHVPSLVQKSVENTMLVVHYHVSLGLLGHFLILCVLFIILILLKNTDWLFVLSFLI